MKTINGPMPTGPDADYSLVSVYADSK